ncbi:hypothetical protein EUGRSUZ_I02355 [Eucalyptus grandis]|uniref:Uncharacterized protein n=2 Tax=Eucalyptus grandis TaxID=71139 RepID=A0ACC3JI07_EUCGR|nr:hypothetical protein EUGRSUZ_I02355 [Eucalyptus grandis]
MAPAGFHPFCRSLEGEDLQHGDVIFGNCILIAIRISSLWHFLSFQILSTLARSLAWSYYHEWHQPMLLASTKTSGLVHEREFLAGLDRQWSIGQLQFSYGRTSKCTCKFP